MMMIKNNPPKAEQKEEVLEKHGDVRIDPYYWLNDRENQEVHAYLKAENYYTETILEPVKKLRESLFSEMKSRMKEDDSSVPWRKNGFYYYQRYEKGNEYPLFCRKKGDLLAEEEVLLNINHLAEGQAFVDIGSIEVSPDQDKLAYTIDFEGRRKYSLYILNLKDGSTESAGIANCGGDLCWANDNKTLFLTVIDEEKLRYDRVFRYVVQSGEPAVEVYYEKDETFYYISTEKTTDDRYILINCTSTMQSETLILDADTPLEPFRVFQARTKDVLYDVEHFRDHFYIITNLNSQNLRLLICP